MTTTDIKCVLVGAAEVGKSAFIEKIKTGKFKHDYRLHPSIVQELGMIPITTNDGIMRFQITKLSGSLGKKNMANHLVGASCAIVMFSSDSKLDRSNTVDNYVDKVKKHCGDIPICIVANKCDLQPNKYSVIEDCIPISVKHNSGLMLPFQFLCRKLTENVSLQVIDSPLDEAASIEKL